MKILINAYACEPNRGSEPGVGWNWAVKLAQYNEVHVITRANNKSIIETYWSNHTKPCSLFFHYYDCNRFLLWAKHHHLPVNLYYALWLHGASSYAKVLNNKYHFDIAHHITFGVYRFLPNMYKLGIPVVLGPVGGGEYTPENLLCLYSFKDKIKEAIRMISNKLTILNPYYHKAMDNASVILAKTQDTKLVFQKRVWQDKTIVELELGIDSMPIISMNDRKRNQFLFVGRFTYWKGIKIALESFCKFCKSYDPNARLIFIGKGEMHDFIISFARNNDIERNIEIIGWMEQKQLADYYKTSCALLFPSMHDSSGNVVLESLSFGLPVICLKCGGPASVMGNLTDTMIEPYNKPIDIVINEMATIMHRLESDDAFYDMIMSKSILRAKEFLWNDKLKKIGDIYRSVIKT